MTTLAGSGWSDLGIATAKSYCKLINDLAKGCDRYHLTTMACNSVGHTWSDPEVLAHFRALITNLAAGNVITRQSNGYTFFGCQVNLSSS